MGTHKLELTQDELDVLRYAFVLFKAKGGFKQMDIIGVDENLLTKKLRECQSEPKVVMKTIEHGGTYE